MGAHLTLVADNSGRAAGSGANAGVARPGASDRPGGTRARRHWVHRRWMPGSPRRGARPAVRRRRDVLRGDRGAVTAEYAIVIMAAVAFAGLLVAIMRSGEIRQMLVDLVQNALGMGG